MSQSRGCRSEGQALVIIPAATAANCVGAQRSSVAAGPPQAILIRDNHGPAMYKGLVFLCLVTARF